jgi:hypothetical protein
VQAPVDEPMVTDEIVNDAIKDVAGNEYTHHARYYDWIDVVTSITGDRPAWGSTVPHIARRINAGHMTLEQVVSIAALVFHTNPEG